MRDTSKPQLSDAPVLIETFRGTDIDKKPIIECVYRGLVCVVSGDGDVIYSVGDVGTRLHTRSCSKPFLVLPLLELGYFRTPNVGPKDLQLSDLALLMSSHSGQNIHTSRVEELLSIIGLDASALRCGVHPPKDTHTRLELKQLHTEPSVLHNNCSGKHTAMLMMCLEKGLDVKNYEDPNHPLQQMIKKTIADTSGLAEHDVGFGIDGCSLPSWVLPLKNTALLYARLSSYRSKLPKSEQPWLGDAFNKIWDAAIAHPEYLAGARQFDTELIRAGKKTIFSKTGADGMQTIAIAPSDNFPSGLGIAIKIADGDARQTIRPLVVKIVLEKLKLWPQDKALDKCLPSFLNYRGLVTGDAVWMPK